MIHDPIMTRDATSRRIMLQPGKPTHTTTTPIIITTLYVVGPPAQSTIASITGHHRIVRMALMGKTINFIPGVWDVLISDHPRIDAAARLHDRRISGTNTGRPGYFANIEPENYALNIISTRPITYYKLINQNVPAGNYMTVATLTAVRL